MIDFNCNCGYKIQIDDAYKGKNLKCPKCGKSQQTNSTESNIPINITCQTCWKTIQVSETKRGKLAECPDCKCYTKVPLKTEVFAEQDNKDRLLLAKQTKDCPFYKEERNSVPFAYYNSRIQTEPLRNNSRVELENIYFGRLFIVIAIIGGIYLFLKFGLSNVSNLSQEFPKNEIAKQKVEAGRIKEAGIAKEKKIEEQRLADEQAKQEAQAEAEAKRQAIRSIDVFVFDKTLFEGTFPKWSVDHELRINGQVFDKITNTSLSVKFIGIQAKEGDEITARSGWKNGFGNVVEVYDYCPNIPIVQADKTSYRIILYKSDSIYNVIQRMENETMSNDNNQNLRE